MNTKITKVYAGWKVETETDIYYFGEYGQFGCNNNDGVVYKDDEAFETGKGVCYVPEYGFESVREDAELNRELNNVLLNSELINNPHVALSGYTRQDFEELCEGTSFNAEDLFNHVDWQTPETLFNEWLEDLEQCDFCHEWFEETEGIFTAGEEKVFLCHRCAQAISDHDGKITIKY